MGLASKLRSIFSKEKVKEQNRIEYLANELIEELKKDGKSIASPDTGENFGHFGIWVFDLGTQDERILVDKIGKWRVKVKPTFKEF